ncbi:MAG: RNA 2',3'-cyclic phosphodiesterase [Deltaproteobacteria bacterium]|nr:RNA 2',3'-cyclic phosphodiesterase [Deltaproteobacteria bacterium]MBW2283132.1 RNA 2',3'-cyclic phosphodiesterase [Deltaproteobacteria bacterium]
MDIRSFLAFELPTEIKRTVSRISGELRPLPLDIRWVRVDNIHLTVIFMGHLAEGLLKDMGENAAHVCRRYGPFQLALSGVGFFGGRKRPRVLWAGLKGDVERMSYFRDALQKRLRPFGITPEKRRFNPHLTLGRFRKGAEGGHLLDEAVSRYRGLEGPVFTLKELLLFKSDLRPGGAIYTRIDGWPLTGAA